MSDTSPPPLKNNEDKSGEIEKKGSVNGVLKRLPRKVLSLLSNLPLAIGEMALIAALMALGILYLVFLYSSLFQFFLLIGISLCFSELGVICLSEIRSTSVISLLVA